MSANPGERRRQRIAHPVPQLQFANRRHVCLYLREPARQQSDVDDLRVARSPLADRSCPQRGVSLPAHPSQHSQEKPPIERQRRRMVDMPMQAHVSRRGDDLVIVRWMYGPGEDSVLSAARAAFASAPVTENVVWSIPTPGDLWFGDSGSPGAEWTREIVWTRGGRYEASTQEVVEEGRLHVVFHVIRRV